MSEINSNSKNRYEELFGTGEAGYKIKAEAFDKIAAEYYFGNFARMQKSDFETLMFSIYIEQILKTYNNDMKETSDYKLSKQLGITQAKVSNLKVRKELQYPYSEFNWKESFKELVKNAHYENGKAVINIPDKNLYNEVKNAIEEMDGYIENTLTSSLMQIPLGYLIDLLLEIEESSSKRTQVRNRLKEQFENYNIDVTELEKESIGEALKRHTKDIAIDTTLELLGMLVPPASALVKSIKKYVK